MNSERFGEPTPELEGQKEITPQSEPAEGKVELQKPEEFKGEDAEVTVKRTSGELEGGWEVLGPDKKKEGYVVVYNHERHKEKTVNIEKLMKLQPFQEGDKVPVIRTKGKIDSEGWVIKKGIGYGWYQVEKTIEGKPPKTESVRKSALIEAKIAELESRRENITAWGDVTSHDRPILEEIEENLKYWQDKLKTTERLAEEFYRKQQNKKDEVEPTPDLDEDIEGRTPRLEDGE
jgi:hypothetical protein